MYVITIDTEKCGGCGECVENCAVEILSLVKENGKMVATVAGDPDECLGCLSCEEMCEEGAITVEEF